MVGFPIGTFSGAPRGEAARPQQKRSTSRKETRPGAMEWAEPSAAEDPHRLAACSTWQPQPTTSAAHESRRMGLRGGGTVTWPGEDRTKLSIDRGAIW